MYGIHENKKTRSIFPFKDRKSAFFASKVPLSKVPLFPLP